MLLYAEAAMGRTETPLKPAFEMAMEPWRETCEGERAIGFGWFVQPTDLASAPDGERRDGRLIWHNGATGGYRSFLGLMPERDCAIVVLSNGTDSVDPALTWPVMKAIARIYAPQSSSR
jgi:CubicO group peptidase (beta-lactamase class C family)